MKIKEKFQFLTLIQAYISSIIFRGLNMNPLVITDFLWVGFTELGQ